MRTKKSLENEIALLKAENERLRVDNSIKDAAMRFTKAEYESGQIDPKTMYAKMLSRLFSMCIVRIQSTRICGEKTMEETEQLLLSTARLLRDAARNDLLDQRCDCSDDACCKCQNGNGH